MGGVRSLFGQLYVQVLAGMALGIAIGLFWPDAGVALKPVADGFIKLIKMLLAPIIFGTVVVGIARIGDLKDVGRIGIKALVYFEVLTTIALLIGLAVVNLVRPGVGMNIDPATLNDTAVKGYEGAAHAQGGITQFLLNIVPDTFLGAFTGGAMLQVILLALLFGVALARAGAAYTPVTDMIDKITHTIFGVVGMVMRLAPLGAGAGIAYTIGAHGVGTLWSLGYLLLALYLTTFLFVVIVLGTVTRMAGLPFLAFLRFIKDEILVVLGTCSTEAVLPRLMEKLERLGVAKPVVGLVLPAGYTFNADGTCIYLTMAAIFVAQATNTHLGLGEQLVILGVLMLTSKGSAGVAGAGFVTLAATIAVFPHIPAAGLVLLLGVDRFLNEARAVTNLIGNSVATVAVARWDGALDVAQARAVLAEGKQ